MARSPPSHESARRLTSLKACQLGAARIRTYVRRSGPRDQTSTLRSLLDGLPFGTLARASGRPVGRGFRRASACGQCGVPTDSAPSEHPTSATRRRAANPDRRVLARFPFIKGPPSAFHRDESPRAIMAPGGWSRAALPFSGGDLRAEPPPDAQLVQADGSVDDLRKMRQPTLVRMWQAGTDDLPPNDAQADRSGLGDRVVGSGSQQRSHSRVRAEPGVPLPLWGMRSALPLSPARPLWPR